MDLNQEASAAHKRTFLDFLDPDVCFFLLSYLHVFVLVFAACVLYLSLELEFVSQAEDVDGRKLMTSTWATDGAGCVHGQASHHVQDHQEASACGPHRSSQLRSRPHSQVYSFLVIITTTY